jgi:uncharacterized protein YueI
MSRSSASKLLKLSSYLQRKYSINESYGIFRHAEDNLDFGKIRSEIVSLQNNIKSQRAELIKCADMFAGAHGEIKKVLERACNRLGGNKTQAGQSLRKYIDGQYAEKLRYFWEQYLTPYFDDIGKNLPTETSYLRDGNVLSVFESIESDIQKICGESSAGGLNKKEIQSINVQLGKIRRAKEMFVGYFEERTIPTIKNIQSKTRLMMEARNMASKKQSSLNLHSNIALQKRAQDSIHNKINEAISAIEKFVKIVSGISSPIPIPKEMISEAIKIAKDLKNEIESLAKNPEEIRGRIQELIDSIELSKQLISSFVKDQVLKNALTQAANKAKEMLEQLKKMF